MYTKMLVWNKKLYNTQLPKKKKWNIFLGAWVSPETCFDHVSGDVYFFTHDVTRKGLSYELYECKSMI